MTAHQAYFVSDLHLFTSRSSGEQHLEAISDIAQSAESFVLGGDIFDFRWTTLGSIEETVTAAADWLRQLSSNAPSCRFYLLLGNHDHNQQYISALGGLQNELANFQWDPYYFRLGCSLFLHGDAADTPRGHVALERARAKWMDEIKRGKAANFVYDMFVHANLHRPVPFLAYPNKRTAKRLLSYLDEIGHGPATGVRNVYFGHTHRQLVNYQFSGVNFHNGGAPMKGVKFRIVHAPVRYLEAA